MTIRKNTTKVDYTNIEDLNNILSNISSNTNYLSIDAALNSEFQEMVIG